MPTKTRTMRVTEMDSKRQELHELVGKCAKLQANYCKEKQIEKPEPHRQVQFDYISAEIKQALKELSAAGLSISKSPQDSASNVAYATIENHKQAYMAATKSITNALLVVQHQIHQSYYTAGIMLFGGADTRSELCKVLNPVVPYNAKQAKAPYEAFQAHQAELVKAAAKEESKADPAGAAPAI